MTSQGCKCTLRLPAGAACGQQLGWQVLRMLMPFCCQVPPLCNVCPSLTQQPSVHCAVLLPAVVLQRTFVRVPKGNMVCASCCCDRCARK